MMILLPTASARYVIGRSRKLRPRLKSRAKDEVLEEHLQRELSDARIARSSDLAEAA
jgi:hypothetical protein